MSGWAALDYLFKNPPQLVNVFGGELIKRAEAHKLLHEPLDFAAVDSHEAAAAHLPNTRPQSNDLNRENNLNREGGGGVDSSDDDSSDEDSSDDDTQNNVENNLNGENNFNRENDDGVEEDADNGRVDDNAEQGIQTNGQRDTAHRTQTNTEDTAVAANEAGGHNGASDDGNIGDRGAGGERNGGAAGEAGHNLHGAVENNDLSWTTMTCNPPWS